MDEAWITRKAAALAAHRSQCDHSGRKVDLSVLSYATTCRSLIDISPSSRPFISRDLTTDQTTCLAIAHTTDPPPPVSSVRWTAERVGAEIGVLMAEGYLGWF